jgi:anthranilate phosphoribosyltransferase
MIEDIVLKVSKKVDLSADEVEKVFDAIAEGRVPEKEIASFLVALSRKKETAIEIAGAARAMRRFVTPISFTKPVVMDTCGTGGDRKGIFNVSTVTAFVIAGAGVAVAKHGNRSVSGSCGSADLLEALGVGIEAPVAVVEKCLKEIGIGFLYAPQLHPAMRYVQPVRKALKQRTIFNIMGPLINPALPTHQLLGVYDHELARPIAEALNELGLKHGMVVWGEGGFDEVTITGKTHVYEVKDNRIKEYTIEPQQMGLEKAAVRDLVGGSVEANKKIALNVFKGVDGPARHMVLLNAACGIYLAGLSQTIKEGVALATSSIDSGAAIKKLDKLIEYTHEDSAQPPDVQEDAA